MINIVLQQAAEERDPLLFWGLVVNAIMAALTLVVVCVSMFQAWVARDTAKRQLRAYVYFSAMDFHVVNTGFAITIHMKNFGLTPAKGISTTVWTGAKDQPDKDEDRRVEMGIIDLAPGGEYKHEVSVGCEAPFKKQVLSGDRNLWLVGEVHYRDIYGKLREHHFRLKYHADQGTLAAERTGNHST